MSGPAASVFRKRLLATLVVAAATLATLALAEAAVRVLGLDRGEGDRLRHHPLFGWTINPDRRAMDGMSPSGFRHPPVTAAKPAGTRRLVILGDSFAQGGAYPYESTFAGLLAEWLAAAGERWEVINLGVSGWGTAQELLAFEAVAVPLAPDAVLLQVFPYNDLCNNSRALALACDTEDYYRPYLEPSDSATAGGDELQPTWLHPVRRRLRSASALFRALERRSFLGLGPPKPPPGLSPPETRQWIMDLHRARAHAAGLDSGAALQAMVPDDLQRPVTRQAWELSETLLARLAEGLERRSIPWLAMVVPNPRSFDPAWVRRIRTGTGWPRGAPIEPGYDTARMEAYLGGLGGRSIDLRRRLLAGPMTATDHFHPSGQKRNLHFNRLGHFRAAGWILEELRALGLTAAEAPDPGFGEVEIVADDAVMPVAVRGLRRLRPASGGPVRVADSGEVSVAFWSPDGAPMALRFRLASPLAGSTVTLWVNGEPSPLTVGADGVLGHTHRFIARPGRNEIRFRFEAYEPAGAHPASFSSLVIERLDTRR